MLYFLLYLFLEVVISMQIAAFIGAIATFLAIVLSAFVGIGILINFRKTLVENMTAVSYNCIDLEQFQRLNLFTLFGAVFLIIPGFLTDIFGIVMQFSVLTTMLVNRYHVKSDKCKPSYEENHIKKDHDVIDVEIISDSSTLK
ncbi:MAG: FxsA family protein [Sulfurimonas sp.]|nr:FxsA family protein [Sulfurimonas sp.]MDQ7061683.1 FxsA family protein [Sulfurimonas sp.]